MRRFPSAGDFCERASVRLDGFRNGLAVNELSFAAAGDQPGFAQNLQVMRNRCPRDAAHGDDFAAVHVAGFGDGLENAEAVPVGQGFRDFFNTGTFHGPIESVAELRPPPPPGFRLRKVPPGMMQPISSILI
jgi:hypothetical protein